MTPTFEHLQGLLKKLPGLGYRSAERLALHLLVEKPETLEPLMAAFKLAQATIHRCPRCGNLAEEETCDICADLRRDDHVLCIVEQVPELAAIERSGSFRGRYHVLHGKLSPIHGIGPEHLNIPALQSRLKDESIREIILALSNDIEGEATCHYLQDVVLAGRELEISRIGFGLPSGGGITFADANTVKSALEGRKIF